MAKFHIITFGCQMNVNDSQWLSRALTSMGHIEEPIAKEADFFILNTCSVRDKPEKNVHSTIGRMRKINPQMWGVVMGCVAQQLGDELLQKHKTIKLVLGTDTLHNAPEYIQEIIIKQEANPLFEIKIKDSHTDFISIFPDRSHYLEDDNTPQAVAYVNIMQGCDNYCSYCIVPYTRGVPKSRSTASILDECRAWLDKGVKEIHLLGQNVNAFGLDRLNDGCTFPELLRKIDKLDGLKRLRFMTPHPKDLADDTIALFGELQSLCPRLHLPIQAGSNRTLERMNRPYTREYYLQLVEKTKKIRSDIAFASDIIVGFPGETETEFQETLDIMQQAPIIFSYSFAYSDRPGTKASLMPDKIEPKIQLDRLERLQDFQRELGAKYLQSFIGKEIEVLIESINKKTCTAQARDIYGNSVHVHCNDPIGSLLKVKVFDTHKHSITAKKI